MNAGQTMLMQLLLVISHSHVWWHGTATELT